MRTLYTLLLSLALFGVSHAQIPTHIQLRLQDTVDFIRTNQGYKGISAAASWKRHGDWKGVAGISYGSVQLTDSMVIGIGSNTKTFLTTAMLRLVELGMLSLDDSVGKWLPAMPHVKGSITVKQLLQHMSGLYNYTQNTLLGDSVNANPYRVWTKAELVKKFIKPQLFNPGTAWNYSNTNYLVAGMIAEQAGGKSVAQLIDDFVLSPAGLNNTFFPPYESVTSTHAWVWHDLGNGYLQPQPLPFEFYSVADAAGGMLSDAADNCKFWVSLFNGDLVQKTTLRDQMMNWEPVNSNLSYGLALMKVKVFNNETYSHGGAILGQFCENLSDTINGITVSVLTNQDSLSNDPIVRALYRILLQQEKLAIAAGVHDVAKSQDLIFPNPASSVVHLSSSSAIREASILDVSGRTLITVPGNGLRVDLDVSALAAGAYFIAIRDADGERVRKFLKE